MILNFLNHKNIYKIFCRVVFFKSNQNIIISENNFSVNNLYAENILIFFIFKLFK